MAIKTRTSIRGLRFIDDRYLYDRVVSGQRIYHRFVDGTDEKTAEKWVAKKISEVVSGRYLPESVTRSLTVRDLLNAYWQEHLSIINTAYTKNRRYHLDRIDAFFGGLTIPPIPPVYGQVPEDVLSAAHVERYIRERSQHKNNRGMNIAPSTIQDELDVLSQAIKFCMERSKSLRIGYNPIKGYERPKQDDPSKIVLDEGAENGPEWKAIYSICSDSIKQLVLCLYETGMRPIEVFSMRRKWWKKYAADRWIIEIPNSRDFKEKTGKKRRVPVSLHLLEAMLPLLRKMKLNDLFFPSPATGGIRTNGWPAFSNAVEKVKDMASDASEFEAFPEFHEWALEESWNEVAISLAWEVRNFDGEGVTPYALRRTRLSIWDAIDEGASRYAGGHVGEHYNSRDTHRKHYIRYPLSRLFRLVGLEYYQVPDLHVLKTA